MTSRKKDFETIKQAWIKNGPSFPIIYFENDSVPECRGFPHVDNLVADYDFVGYDYGFEDYLIDSTGRVFKLEFKNFLYPVLTDKIVNLSELQNKLKPILIESKVEDIDGIINNGEVADIISKVSNFYFW